MADGSITFSTKLDNKDLEKDLAKIIKEIKKTEDLISAGEAKKSPLVKQAEELERKMGEARAEVNRYRQEWASGVVGSDGKQSAAQGRLSGLQNEYQKVVGQIDKIDAKLTPAYEKLDGMKVEAGALQQRIAKASVATGRMRDATAAAEKQMAKFTKRVVGLAKRVFVFTIITQALRSIKDWLWSAIKTNDEATAAVARLKGALRTLAQPLVEVVIPAFTTLVNILTVLISKVAQLVSRAFGTTAEASAKAAEELYNEQQALKGVGDAAKKTTKQLASFDEINRLGGDDSSETTEAPDFSAVTDDSWLDFMLDDVAGKVAAALMLAGIALIAIGAATGNLGLVLAGLLLLGAGVVIGDELDGFASWAETLGLDGVTQYVAIALLLGGIALVAIGAATGRILVVIAGLGLLGLGIALAEESEAVQSWVKTLGLDSVNQFVSTALLLGGIAIVAIGACVGNVMMVIAGLGMIGGAVAYADEETTASWVETLGLDSVFDYVAKGTILAGLALVAIGAAMGNIYMVVAGALLAGLGATGDAIGEETLSEWWEVLKLTSVQQWVGAACLLVGIALVAVGACMGNIVMILAGAVILGVGTITSATDGNLEDWVTTLGLEKVAGWVTAGLLLVGIALVVIGICTGNIMMILAGAGLLGAGISVGVTSGTFDGWLSALATFKENALSLLSSLWEEAKTLWNNFWGLFSGNNSKFATGELGIGGGMFGGEVSLKAPGLATGSVVPPNREFLAVLGDNTTETEVVSPISTMKQAFLEAMQEGGMGNGNMTITINPGAGIARYLKYELDSETTRRGGKLVTQV